MTHLPSLTDEELISMVRTQLDLVTSSLERELAERLAAAIDGAEDTTDLEKEIEQMTDTNAELSERIRELEDTIYDLKNPS